MSNLVERLRENLAKVIKGKPTEIDLLIACFLGGGHVLLNDVPGVGKTTLAKAISTSIAGAFCRVQFTPDRVLPVTEPVSFHRRSSFRRRESVTRSPRADE